MNRKQTLKALTNIAERLCKEYNLTIVSKNAKTMGVWDYVVKDKSLSDILTEEFQKRGETFEEIHFTNVPIEDYDLHKDFKVTLGYYWTSPQICVGTQWGDGYANACFCDKDNKDDGDNYSLSSSQIFKEGGIPLFNKIMEYWYEEKTKIENQ